MPRSVEATVGGQVLKHLVQVGDIITADTEVALIDSMKMHIPVVAEHAGKVAKWLVAEGAAVKEGQALLVLES
jgi:acetyl-CoA carboxylase biotin carboxyl carrier protein